MSPVALNRILIILGVLGLYVAGVLSAEHLWSIAIPCTGDGGCETVAKHPSSYFLTLPVAFYGFAGYLLLTAIATVVGFSGKLLSRPLIAIGYGVSAIGMITSLYLQYISFNVIGAKCVWCMSSAAIMILTFVAYTMLFNKVGTIEIDEPQKNPKAMFIGLGGVAAACLAVFGTIYGRDTVINRGEILDPALESKLVPEPRSSRNQLGPDDAPVTIVEYADLCCPTCRKSFPKIKELAIKYSGKIRVVFRHFPIDQLKGHEMALVVATTAELAAEKGKFWEFAEAFTAPEEAATTREGVDAIAKTVGITPQEIQKEIDNPESVAVKRWARDAQDALEHFKITGTPMYIIAVKGRPIKKVANIVAVINELDHPEVKKLMGK